MNRLTHLPTLRIKQGPWRDIHYRGKAHPAAPGDTIATALYANGVRIFGRSLKYHRPRGLYSLDGECSNTTMAVDGVPNVRTETVPVKPGMTVKAQNVVGSAERDLLGFMDALSFAMPAGFYYKTMHKPAPVWPLAINRIRKQAGLGAIAPDFEITGVFDELYPKADVCVVGGGPAGMCAALASAEAGLRVILLEARPWLGGFFEYRAAAHPGGGNLYERARELADQVEKAPSIRVFTNAAMTGAYHDNLITAVQQGGDDDPFDSRYLQIRAGAMVAATGCIERPLLFENNEKPGIMQVGCAHRLARTWGLMPGEKIAFSVGHDLGLEAALDLADLGGRVTCVADIREDGQDPALVAALEERRIPYFKGWVAVDAQGRPTLRRAVFSTITGTVHKEFSCDVLVASAGFTPVTGPLNTAGAKLAYDNHTGFFLPTDLPPKTHAAGRIIGLQDPLSLETSGRLAGLRSAADCGKRVDDAIREAESALVSQPGPERGCKLVTAPVKGNKTFICFDEDTTLKNVKQAMAQGFDVPELIKRFTAAGTGPGQGGIPGHNLPLFVAQTTASPDRHPRPTTVRAPLVPPLMAEYAGANHDMSKRTPVHESQAEAGGRMERIAVWNRARVFSKDKGAKSEIENVRTNVGMLDASTLGKFRIFGPDAVKALQRVYAGDMTKIPSKRMKYAAMCNDDGCLLDDGVIVKQGENDFYFTASTGRAGQTVEWIRFHTKYENWDFHLVNLTDAYGVINLAGPNARKVLEKVADADVSNDAFPFMGYREFTVKGTIPVRAMRLGFVGELSYEFHVPSSWMEALWDVLTEAGAEFGIRNFGLEAQNTLRMEKGHVIIGSESEQRTNLLDLGLGFLWDRNKPKVKTVGTVALRQAEGQKGRLKLVGFRMTDPADRAPKDGSPIVDERIRGYVCTARYSHTLDMPVGMALVEDALTPEGTRLSIFEDGCEGNLIHGEIVPMPFYDPKGERMRM
jgi:sarcosine oxidase subunit alpha